MMYLSLTQSQIAIKPATMIGINSALLKYLSIHIVWITRQSTVKLLYTFGLSLSACNTEQKRCHLKILSYVLFQLKFLSMYVCVLNSLIHI